MPSSLHSKLASVTSSLMAGGASREPGRRIKQSENAAGRRIITGRQHGLACRESAGHTIKQPLEHRCRLDACLEHCGGGVRKGKKQGVCRG